MNKKQLFFSWKLINYSIVFFSGACLSIAFAPIEKTLFIWISFIPLLLICQSQAFWKNWRYGYFFGLGHFYTSFHWLSTIHFLLPLGIAFYCAIFPAFWIAIIMHFDFILRTPQFVKAQALLSNFKPKKVTKELSPICQCLIVLSGGALWVMFEWLRSHLFTGLAWNLIGVSLWKNTGIISIVAYTGVYGLSFLIIAFNIALYFAISSYIYNKKRLTLKSCPLIMLFFLILPIFILCLKKQTTYDKTIKVLTIQGNIEQCRQWSKAQLNKAISVYTNYSKLIGKNIKADLIIWPETAVPAALRFNEQYFNAFQNTIETVNLPIMLGSIDFLRYTENNKYKSKGYNSILYYNKKGILENSYRKTHLVPFGEYTPFEKIFPWLSDLIGMGRSLNKGKDFSVFDIGKDVYAGVNICYEDTFPEISRQFILNNANIIFTLTNDAWFKQSSASRQHLAHTVFRAVENNVPVLRVGNNSYTCLILPTGKVTNILYDKLTNKYFIRGAKVYSIPVNTNHKLTFYTKYGDIFAYICNIIGSILIIYIISINFRRRMKLYNDITSTTIK